MSNVFPPVSETLPHGPPMVLLDRILYSDPSRTECEVTIRPGAPFVDQEGIPGLVTLEYMAQCIGVGAGLESIERGEAPWRGYLIGCRDMEIRLLRVPLASELRVIARKDWGLSTFGHFRCEVLLADQLVSAALLSVARFAPDKGTTDAA